MKLECFKFAMASAVSAALLWVICSLLVLAMPTMMLSMSGDMLHMSLTQMNWQLTLLGIIKGLVAWSVTAGFFGGILAAVYNRLLD